MNGLPSEIELRNLREGAETREWAVADLLAYLPMDIAGDAWAAMAKGLERAGYDAYFKQETGFRTLWIRRRPKKPKARARDVE